MMFINDDIFAPLLRQAVGLTGHGNRDYGAFPAYNIEKLQDNDFQISVAVPGLTEEDLDISVENQILTIKSAVKTETAEDGKNFLYRGFTHTGFERRFSLADHVEVESAELLNGILHIRLHSQLPEQKKPRQIAIGSGNKRTPLKQAA